MYSVKELIKRREQNDNIQLTDIEREDEQRHQARAEITTGNGTKSYTPALSPIAKAVSTVIEQPQAVQADNTQTTEKGKKPFVLYRADNRSYNEMQTSSPEGFKAWTHLDTASARKFANVFTGNKDTSGLPKGLIENINKWGTSPKLADLSTFIKYTKDRSTVWVSTAINTEAGGQSSGAPLYEISMNLYESKILRQKMTLSPEGRTKNMEYTLLTDKPDIEQSTVIALNHGPVGDEEISFLTTIPMQYIKPYLGPR